MGLIEHRVRAIARVLYMVDGADFDLIVRERADGPTATLVARKIAEALPDVHVPDEAAIERGASQLRGAVEALGDAYSALTDGEGLGPDVSEEAVEQARDILAKALALCVAPGDGHGS